MLFRLAGLLLLCSPVLSSTAQTAGLLLGLRHPEPITEPLPYRLSALDSLSRATYTTYLLSWEHGAAHLVGEASGLHIPRGTRFWKVDVKRSVYNAWVEDFVWAAPYPDPPVLTGIDAFNGEHCEGHRVQNIHYAGPNYLALEQQSTGYCEDAAHPWHFNTLAVIPIDSTSHLGLTIGKVLSPAAEEAFRETAAQFLAQQEAEESPYVAEPDPASWCLQRRHGKWIAVGRLDPASASMQGVFADLDLPVAVAPQVASHNELSPAWEAVVAFAPDALDAFSTPDGDQLIILHGDSLTVHPLLNGQIGPADFKLPLAPGSTAVMTRWAALPAVQQWTEHFRPPRPASLP